jgi:hypothetical protein
VRVIIAIPLLLTLYGCPYSSPYKLDDIPGSYIDDRILGEWLVPITNNNKSEDLKMTISRNGESEYFIHFSSIPCNLKPFFRTDSDTIQALAFISLVAEREVLNIEIADQTYLAEIVFRNEKFCLFPLSDHFTSKLVKNNAELRKALEIHFRTRLKASYADEFSFRDITKVN